MKKRKTDEIWFLYDDLLFPEVLKKLQIKAKFLTFAVTQGDIRDFAFKTKGNLMHTRTVRRLIIIPTNKRNFIVGALFLVNKDSLHKLYSYYMSTENYNVVNSKHDIYRVFINSAYPIKFKSMKDLEEHKYAIGREIRVKIFIFNKYKTSYKKRINRFVKKSKNNYNQVSTLFEKEKANGLE